MEKISNGGYVCTCLMFSNYHKLIEKETFELPKAFKKETFDVRYGNHMDTSLVIFPLEH